MGTAIISEENVGFEGRYRGTFNSWRLRLDLAPTKIECARHELN